MEYLSFSELLTDLETVKRGTNDKLTIKRKINGRWELISLSNYRNSEDLILVETEELAFTVTRWDVDFTISQQITQNTNN